MRTNSSAIRASVFALLALVAVACGDSTSDRYLNDTWTWKGNDWNQAAGAGAPEWRFGALFVYDESTQEIVLFGGQDADGRVLSDTWTWDGHWTQRNPPVSPPARLWPAGAYDPVRGEVVMFGGSKGPNAGYWDDTWTWNGESWTRKAAGGESPPAQSFGPSAAAFDPLTRQIVMVNDRFCLLRPGEVCPADTWTWNGSRWRNQPSGQNVDSSQLDGLLYTDSDRGRVILLSTSFWYLTGGSLDWSGSDWSPVMLPASAQTSFAAIAYDSNTASLVSFGGERCPTASSAETRTMHGTDWSLVAPSTVPPARTETYLAYDSEIRGLVMFGGWVEGECSGIAALP